LAAPTTQFHGTDPEGQLAIKITNALPRGNKQGTRAITASGKILLDGGNYHYVDVGKALEAWKQLPETERKPGAIKVEELTGEALKLRRDRYPQPPPGGLIVRVYQRVTGVREKDQTGARYRQDPAPDFLWLTEADWKSLVPARLERGDQFPFPESLADFLCRGYLRDSGRGGEGAWFAGTLRSKELTLRVEEVSATCVRLSLRGTVLLASDQSASNDNGGYDARLWGFLEYDPRKKAFQRFDIVAFGEAWGHAGGACGGAYIFPYHVNLGVAFELAQGNSPADRVFPGWWPWILRSRNK
jgi:hypothetical protein